MSYAKNILWLFVNLCAWCDGFPISFYKLKGHLPIIKTYLTSDDEEVVHYACLFFQYFIEDNEPNKEVCVDCILLLVVCTEFGCSSYDHEASE